MDNIYPSKIKASKVVSPFSSGLPPYPTVPSHCSISHCWHPASKASIAEDFSFSNESQAKFVMLIKKLQK